VMTGRDRCDEILTLNDDVLSTYPQPTKAKYKGGGGRKGRSGSTSVPQQGLAMPTESVLAEQVRTWVDRMAPGVTHLTDAAVARAVTCYGGGASVGEACTEARRLIRCWLRHPSRGRGSGQNELPGAS
jgi:hypothetical protein